MHVSKSYIALAFFFAFSCLAVNSWAQPMRFQSISIQSGFTQNTGYCISQTSDGFIWFGSQGGLSRYDGHNVQVYKKKGSRPYDLCGNTIRSLLADGIDTLWVGTTDGISIYRPQNDKFYPPSAFFQLATVLDKLSVKKIKADAQGRIWILSVHTGLYCFDKKNRQIQHYFADKATAAKLNNLVLDEQGNLVVVADQELYCFVKNQLRPLHLRAKVALLRRVGSLQDAAFTRGELWLATAKVGLFRLKADTSLLLLDHIHNRNAGSPLTQNGMKCLLKDHKGNIWIGTSNDGLLHYDYASGKMRNGRQELCNPTSLHYNAVHSLFEDRQGILWIGLSYGIDQHDANKNPFETQALPRKKQATTGTDITVLSLYLDQDSMLYIGTLGGGMMLTDKNFKHFRYLRQQDSNPASLLHNEVYSFCREEKGLFWIATSGGLCSYDPRLPEQSRFRSYCRDSAGGTPHFYSLVLLQHENALLLGGDNVLYKFDLTSNKWTALLDPALFVRQHNFTITFMQEDSGLLPGAGWVWLCTSGEGLLAYNYLSGQFREFPAVKRLSAIVKHLQVVDKTLWLGSKKGLIAFPVNSLEPPLLYGNDKGLAGDRVYAVQADLQKNIWVSTNYGISRWHESTQTFTNYDSGPSPGGTEFNTAGTCRDKEGYLYFGGVHGITRFDPKEIQPSTFSPQPLITEIKVMNKAYSGAGNTPYIRELQLSYKQNFITFSFVALNFLPSENTSYRYKMEGINQEWQDAGPNNTANYTDLLPGRYVFKVQAANKDGVWSAITAIKLILVPPFWKTLWFYTLTALLLTAIAWYAIVLRVRYVRRQGNLNAQIAEMEMKALHTQMNPHFIFNCLGSIKQMIQDREQNGANHYLTKFARLIRMSLEHSQKPLITLAENNEYLTHYLLMEQLRFSDSFRYRIAVAENIDSNNIVFPPMMIQPLVENGIWHGLLEKEGDRLLSIRYFKTNNTLVCEIEDNGVGLQHARTNTKDHESFGIANVNKRLELLNRKYKLQCRLEIRPLYTKEGYNRGTLVLLTLPIIIQ